MFYFDTRCVNRGCTEVNQGRNRDGCWRWSSSATRHQHTHSSRPTPNYTKDTICCICKEIVTSIASEDGRISPKHVELKEHK